MSIRLLASGALLSDPQRRQGAKGPFATATIRVQTEDEAVLVSVLAFGETAERLLGLAKGDAVSIAGRAKLSAWTGRDGAEKHGLSIVADQVATARPVAARTSRRREAHAYRAPAQPPIRSDDDGLMPSDSVNDLWRGEP